MTTRHIVDDAIWFWERGRLIYNAVLIVPVAITVVSQSDYWGSDVYIWIGIGALIANVLYCAAYPIDLLLQHSSWRASWLEFRWVFWLLGTILALLLTIEFASALWI